MNFNMQPMCCGAVWMSGLYYLTEEKFKKEVKHFLETAYNEEFGAHPFLPEVYQCVTSTGHPALREILEKLGFTAQPFYSVHPGYSDPELKKRYKPTLMLHTFIGDIESIVGPVKFEGKNYADRKD